MKAPRELITDLIVQIAKVDPAQVRPDARFIDFGLDSVKALDLVVELEEAYELEIPDRDLVEVRTLGELATYVENRLERGA